MVGAGIAAAQIAALARCCQGPSSGRGNSSLGLPMQETNRKIKDYFCGAKEILTTPSV